MVFFAETVFNCFSWKWNKLGRYVSIEKIWNVKEAKYRINEMFILFLQSTTNCRNEWTKRKSTNFYFQAKMYYWLQQRNDWYWSLRSDISVLLCYEEMLESKNIFFYICDMALFNSYILYNKNNMETQLHRV